MKNGCSRAALLLAVVALIGVVWQGTVLGADPQKDRSAGLKQPPKLQIIFDRLDIIDDGDPVGGAGEITLTVSVVHTSPYCPPNRNWPKWRICDSWKYKKEVKARTGEKVTLGHALPGSKEYVDTKPFGALEIYLHVSEKDIPTPEITAAWKSSQPIPDIRHTADGDWGIGSHFLDEKGDSEWGEVSVRLHYRVKAIKPNLKMEDFWTVPRVPNTAYPETKLCVKAANIGTFPSSPFITVIYVNDMSRPRFALHRMEGLPADHRVKQYCGKMPTPNEGNNRIRVVLEPIKYDFDRKNNRLEKEIYASKRITHQEQFKRVKQQVIAYGKKVNELRVALGLAAGPGSGSSKTLLMASLVNPGGSALLHDGRGLRAGSYNPPDSRTRLAVDKGQMKPKVRGSKDAPKPAEQKVSPLHPKKASPTEAIEIIASITSWLGNIRLEADFLSHTYKELEMNKNTKRADQLSKYALHLIQVSKNLDHAVRSYNLPEVEKGARKLVKGKVFMNGIIKALGRFA